MIHTLPIGGIEEYKPYPCFVLHVLAIHISPHFGCVDAKMSSLILVQTLSHTIYTGVLASNAGTRRGEFRCVYNMCKTQNHDGNDALYHTI